MKLLVDGDILLYQFAFTNEFTLQWSELVESKVIRPDRAVFEVDDFVMGLLEKTKCSEYVVCLSDDRNFRYLVLESYKSNRTSERPELYTVIRKHFIDKHPTKSVPFLEADDVMGILSTKHPGKYVVASIDKDMKTIPGLLFNWNKDTHVKTIKKLEADFHWMFQTLTGDTVDGYKGCPGIGPVKAAAILNGSRDLADMWNRVVETYLLKGLTEEDALAQARLARILRASDYDFKKKEVILWQQPS